MVRTQVYLTEEEKSSLESAAVSHGISQSDLIRQAIDELLAKTGQIDKVQYLMKLQEFGLRETILPTFAIYEPVGAGDRHDEKKYFNRYGYRDRFPTRGPPGQIAF